MSEQIYQPTPRQLRTGEVCAICRHRTPPKDRSCCDYCMPPDEGELIERGRRNTMRATAEAALLRSRQGWRNAIELGVLPARYHEEAESIIDELTAALKAIGSEKAVF